MLQRSTQGQVPKTRVVLRFVDVGYTCVEDAQRLRCTALLPYNIRSVHDDTCSRLHEGAKCQSCVTGVQDEASHQSDLKIPQNQKYKNVVLTRFRYHKRRQQGIRLNFNRVRRHYIKRRVAPSEVGPCCVRSIAIPGYPTNNRGKISTE